MDQLPHSPDYMKVCYKALLDVYAEIEEKLASEGNLYAIHHARESVSPRSYRNLKLHEHYIYISLYHE